MGAPPRPAARDMACAVYTKACTPCFQGALAPHRIHWTAGKLLFRLQSEHGVRCGADAECSFPDGHAHRGRRREQGEQQGGGVRTRLTIRQSSNCTARPQARARRAARRRCADPHDYRRQSSNCTAKPQTRANRAARLRCADPLALRSPGRGFGRTGSHRGGVNFPGNALHPTGAIMGLYCDLVQFFLISAPVGCLHISRKGTYARFRNKISGLLK